MNNSIIQILELIVYDIKKNYDLFNENNLIKAISQFQNNILDSRQKDNDINFVLNNLTLKDIINYSKKLNISLISPPKSKPKLMPLINALIVQSNKKSDFLKLIESEKLVKGKPKSQKKKETTTLSSAEYETLRKKWLTTENLNELETTLSPMNMNLIRDITRPWNLKPVGRAKKDLVDAVLNYIKKLKGLSKLGT